MSIYYGRSIYSMSRSLGISLRGDKKEFSRGKKRTTPPGQHGLKKTRRRKVSLYASQNKEKQKLRFLYGLKEKQLKNLFLNLKQKKGDVRQHLLTYLESRMDNLVFRSGLFSTRRFARQWVSHGHFLINGKKVNKPGYSVKPDSVVTLKKKMLQNEIIKQQLQQNVKPSAYLKLDINEKEANITYLRYPEPEELEKGIDIAAVVEWYNKKI